MPTSPLPLNDFFVIDLTAHRAGPTAVRQLADWGAQVIKVEPPGEQVDATGSRRDGPDFQNLHRNKRSMTLNLKSKEGLDVFFKLAKRADVIVENYKSDVKHRLGIASRGLARTDPPAPSRPEICPAASASSCPHLQRVRNAAQGLIDR